MSGYDDNASPKVKVSWYLHADSVEAFKRIGDSMVPPKSASEVLRMVMRRFITQVEQERVR